MADNHARFALESHERIMESLFAEVGTHDPADDIRSDTPPRASLGLDGEYADSHNMGRALWSW